MKKIIGLLAVILVSSTTLFAQQQTDPTPPQDQGLPYTRSSGSMALNLFANDFALFEGSRYGVAKGYRVWLDNKDLISGEAITRDGEIYVPRSFAAVLGQQAYQGPCHSN